jgi:hypothetical protein
MLLDLSDIEPKVFPSVTICPVADAAVRDPEIVNAPEFVDKLVILLVTSLPS